MDLSNLRDRLATARTHHSHSISRSSKLVKGVLLLLCAAVAGVAQFATWAADKSPEPWQIIGIVATIGVLIGGVFVLATERDAADALDVADRAMDEIREYESRIEDLENYINSCNRAVVTYQTCLAIRGAIEQSTVGTSGTIDNLLIRIFQLVSRQLAIAADFHQSDTWTIGVYKAIPTAQSDRFALKCIVHRRAIECKIEDARVWPEGVGIAGICFSNEKEIVIPDMHIEGISAIFGPRDLARAYDGQRYASMVSVPIMVAGRQRPWGVVNATSNRSGHFSTESGPGFKTDEPIRALAAFIALAIATDDARLRVAHSTIAPV